MGDYIFGSKTVEAVVGLVGKQKSDGLFCTISKCIPMCVAGSMAAQVWANFNHFHNFTLGKKEALENAKRGTTTAFFGPTHFFCAMRAPDRFRQF